jgi:hypothetical protein
MDDNNETIIAPQADSFAAVLALINLITDPKAAGVRLRSFQEREAAAVKAEASLATAKAQHDAAISKERAALEKRAAEIDKFFKEVHSRKRTLDERERSREEYHQEVERRELNLKRRLMSDLGLTSHPLQAQSVPSFAELDQMRLRTPDHHFGQPQQPREGTDEVVDEVVNDRPDLSVRRAVPVSPPRSAAERRAERAAAGLR